MAADSQIFSLAPSLSGFERLKAYGSSTGSTVRSSVSKVCSAVRRTAKRLPLLAAVGPRASQLRSTQEVG